MGAEVSAMCVMDTLKSGLLYVTLYDAPHYSLNVLSLGDIDSSKALMMLARIPLASVVEIEQTKKFYKH